MLKIKLTLIVSLIMVVTRLSAQNSIPYTFLNNMVQPAPNAAALGKYADYPVSYYTGVPEISVPLYNLNDGGINLPISLSYHASGIRVSELATWVGLGWALNAGGLITRTVMGSPDEGTRKVSTNTIGPRGYYRDSGLYKVPLLPYPKPADSTTSDPDDNFIRYTVPGIAGTFLDTEPDIYTFNFNGHAGKFVFDEYRHAKLLEDDNLKIAVNYTTRSFNSFTITTPDGIKYIFGENSMYETTNPSSTQSGTDYDSAAPSSWLLTTIINPNTKDTARLTYTPEIYTYHDLGTESNLYLTNAPASFPNVHPNDLQDACDLGGIALNFLTTTVSGLRLTAITTKNFTVTFIANNARTDLLSGSTFKPYSLDAVKIYNNTNACIKQFSLTHSYFTSTANTTERVTQYLNGAGDNITDRYRLKLTSVTEYSGDGVLQKPPYLFTYYEATQLPRRMSFDQDHWGFCNNWNGDYNSYFTPTVTAGICTFSSAGAVRTSSFPAMEGFTLTSITDPLGAVTNFVYEGNTASNAYPANSLVGGLRINQISVTDNITGNIQTRKFAYNNSGQLFRMPVYLTTLYNEFYWAEPMGLSGNHGYIGYSQAYTFFGILRQSQSVVPLQEPQGGHIGYASVTETFGANGEGGYKTRYYKVTGDHADSLSSRTDISAYTANGYLKVIFPPDSVKYRYGLYGNSHYSDFSVDTMVQPQNLHYYNGYNVTNYYPFSPNEVDFQRGKLLSEQTFDASGNPLVTITNVYNHIYHENNLIRGIKCYPTTTLIGNSSINWYALTYYKLHTGISHLISTTKKTYTGTNYVAETTKYGYESPYHTLSTSDTTTDSQSSTLINKTYYSLDYSPTATTDNVFGKMKARNLLEPVRKDNWKNGNLTGERVTKFYDFASASPDTLINPVNIYNLETAAPLTPTQANESLTWTAPVTTLIPNTYLITKVGFYFDPTTGKMINQQLTADKAQGIQWSNKLNLPVALVDNATNTPTLKEFYYEGFEESTSPQLYTGNAHTGTKSVFAPYTVTWTLPNSRSYVISYWYLTSGIWTYRQEQSFTGSMVLTGGTQYDDIRIHPVNANMVNYTYDANGNLTSTTDAKALSTYYEYDSFQRLRNVRDYKKNIVKSICYNYSGQASGCFVNMPSYSNVIQSGTFTKNDCSAGYSGSQVNYTVAAGTYTSNISAADAYNQAQADINANGQTYANLNGGCIVTTPFYLTNDTNSGYQVNFSNSSMSITYDFQNNGNSTLQVPVGTYDINVFPTGAYVTHNIALTGQTTVVAPRATFRNVNVSSGSNLLLSLY